MRWAFIERGQWWAERGAWAACSCFGAYLIAAGRTCGSVTPQVRATTFYDASADDLLVSNRCSGNLSG